MNTQPKRHVVSMDGIVETAAKVATRNPFQARKSSSTGEGGFGMKNSNRKKRKPFSQTKKGKKQTRVYHAEFGSGKARKISKPKTESDTITSSKNNIRIIPIGGG